MIIFLKANSMNYYPIFKISWTTPLICDDFIGENCINLTCHHCIFKMNPVSMEFLSEKLVWVRIPKTTMHYHKNIYFQGWWGTSKWKIRPLQVTYNRLSCLSDLTSSICWLLKATLRILAMYEDQKGPLFYIFFDVSLNVPAIKNMNVTKASFRFLIVQD